MPNSNKPDWFAKLSVFLLAIALIHFVVNIAMVVLEGTP
jgi:hypothetical protein